MKKQKVTSGEREVSAINWRLLMVLLILCAPLAAGAYWALYEYILTPETQYIIEPYSSPTPTPDTFAGAPTFTPAPPTPQPTPVAVAEVAHTGSAPLGPGNARAVALLTKVNGLSAPVAAVAYSPDGRWLAGGGSDGTIRVWDAQTGAEHLHMQSASNRVDSVAFRADGVLLAVAGQDNVVRLFDVGSGSELSPLVGPSGAVTAVAFSPRGNLIAAASDDGNVYLWDSTTGQRVATLRGHTSYVTDVAFSGDGTMLASSSEDDTVRVWKVPAGGSLAVLEHAANVDAIAFHPGGGRLASASGSVIRVWNVSAQTITAELSGHVGTITDLAYSPTGLLLASVGAGLNDDTIRLWNADGAEIRALEPDDRVSAVAFSPDGRTLAGASAAYVGLWGVPSQAADVMVADPGLATFVTPTVAVVQDALDPGTLGSEVAAQVVSDQSGGEGVCVLTARHDDINLRAGPGVEYDRVGTLSQGDTDTADGWATASNGYTWWRLSTSGGWVRADLVTFPDVCFTLPPVSSN